MNFIFSYLVIATAYAQLPLPPRVDKVTNTSKIITFLCDTVLSWIFTAAIILSIVMVLIAAFRYMTSAGDATKVKLATNMLIFAAVGVAVAILARTLPILVGSLVAQSLTLDPCPAAGGQTTTTTTT
jgi:hypothetical protein